MIKAIFFDIDDTLYDHSYHVSLAITALQSEYEFLGLYSHEYLVELSQSILEEVHILLLQGTVTPEHSRRIRWQRFLHECKDARSEERASEIAQKYASFYYQAERTTPGSIPLLQELKKKYALGVISNNLLDEQIKKMHRIGIAEYLDTFTISEEAGYAKPDPKIFEIALERAGVKPQESIFIGDSWTNDVLGAQNAGIHPIWFNRSGAFPDDPAITQITSFEPIEEVLHCILNKTGANS